MDADDMLPDLSSDSESDSDNVHSATAADPVGPPQSSSHSHPGPEADSEFTRLARETGLDDLSESEDDEDNNSNIENIGNAGVDAIRVESLPEATGGRRSSFRLPSSISKSLPIREGVKIPADRKLIHIKPGPHCFFSVGPYSASLGRQILEGSEGRYHGSNVAFWKFDPTNHENITSNARFIRWSDGTASLAIGKNFFHLDEREFPNDEYRHVFQLFSEYSACNGKIDKKFAIKPESNVIEEGIRTQSLCEKAFQKKEESAKFANTSDPSFFSNTQNEAEREELRLRRKNARRYTNSTAAEEEEQIDATIVTSDVGNKRRRDNIDESRLLAIKSASTRNTAANSRSNVRSNAHEDVDDADSGSDDRDSSNDDDHHRSSSSSASTSGSSRHRSSAMSNHRDRRSEPQQQQQQQLSRSAASTTSMSSASTKKSASASASSLHSGSSSHPVDNSSYLDGDEEDLTSRRRVSRPSSKRVLHDDDDDDFGGDGGGGDDY